MDGTIRSPRLTIRLVTREKGRSQTSPADKTWDRFASRLRGAGREDNGTECVLTSHSASASHIYQPT